MIHNKSKFCALSALLLLGMTWAPRPSTAQVFFNGSGTLAGGIVSARATFSINSNGQLVITLENTSVNSSPQGTQNRSQLLTDLFFSVEEADPVLSLADARGTVVQFGLPGIQDADLNATSAHTGGYQLKGYPGGTFPDNNNGDSFPYEYGISTVGDSGLFNGNLVGNENYSLIAPLTNISKPGLNNIPLADGSVRFTLNGFTGLDVSQIGNVAFSFGSAPGLVAPSDGGNPPAGGLDPVVPEPNALALLLGVLVSGSLFNLRRLRRR
jgi:hypothetical protein